MAVTWHYDEIDDPEHRFEVRGAQPLYFDLGEGDFFLAWRYDDGSYRVSLFEFQWVANGSVRGYGRSDSVRFKRWTGRRLEWMMENLTKEQLMYELRSNSSSKRRTAQPTESELVNMEREKDAV